MLVHRPRRCFKSNPPSPETDAWVHTLCFTDMTDVVALITTVLPNCQVQSLLDTLESIGVSSLEDLGFVEPDDLEGVLKKVESRKLLARAKGE